MQKVALRIAQRIRGIAVKETVPVGKGSKRWRITTKKGQVIDGGRDKQGGELRRSVSVSKYGDGAIVATNKAYARAVHEGRKAIVIRPRKKRALAWNGGNSVAKKVFQPAREGQPFFREAVDQFETNLDNEIQVLQLEDGLADQLRAALQNKGLKVELKG